MFITHIDKRILKMDLLCSAGTKSFLFCIGFCSEYSLCNKNVHEKKMKVLGSVLGTTIDKRRYKIRLDFAA